MWETIRETTTPHTRDGRLFACKESDDQVRRRANEADNCNKVGAR